MTLRPSAVILWAVPPLLSAFLLSRPSVADPAQMDMGGLYGPYTTHREASGTSWQPDSTPIENISWMRENWMFMLHGFANVGYDNQGGPRGNDQAFTTNMFMFMGQRTMGNDTVGFRTMASLEPAM